MPIRLYKCPFCGEHTEELFWGDYPKEIDCKCGRKAKNKFGAPGAVIMAWRPGFDVATGKTFDTEGAYKEYLRKNNLREDKGMRGHGSRSEPEDKAGKMAYLDRKEQKLKRHT
jgi:hypothetical protein